VNGIVFVGRICASELKDDFTAARVLWKKTRYVVNIAVQYYPAAFCGVVLCDCPID
jgi:hypothetical protein